MKHLYFSHVASASSVIYRSRWILTGANALSCGLPPRSSRRSLPSNHMGCSPCG
uniref:Uncharacterized protein n=1 Tax=Siphoviridae sp. ctrEg9 TaxID=2825688 RepID=A0A8S5PFN2_9CAUD|nr:MAG TPA: hypothetical protein [Siphoviridae sp. ctrEg9]